MAEKSVKQIKLYIYRKYNPIILQDDLQDQQSEVSSQEQIAKSDATNHEESEEKNDESHNSTIFMEDRTETQNKNDSEKEKTKEMIVSLLQRSVKLKVDADTAIEQKASPGWDRLKSSVLKGMSETSPLRIQLQACLQAPEPN